MKLSSTDLKAYTSIDQKIFNKSLNNNKQNMANRERNRSEKCKISLKLKDFPLKKKLKEKKKELELGK